MGKLLIISSAPIENKVCLQAGLKVVPSKKYTYYRILLPKEIVNALKLTPDTHIEIWAECGCLYVEKLK